MLPVLLLHGALGTKTDLDPLKNDLQNKGCEVHSFSFSGHDRRAPTKYSIPRFAEETESYIRLNGLEPCHVFGYSMGAYIALYLSIHQPQLLSSISSYGTKFDWSQTSVNKETALLVPEIMQEKIPGFVEQLQIKHGEAWSVVVRQTADLMRNIGQKQYLNDATLALVKQPVLLGLGKKDHMVTESETAHVAQHLPRATRFFRPEGKHALNSVNPEELSEILLQFFNVAENS